MRDRRRSGSRIGMYCSCHDLSRLAHRRAHEDGQRPSCSSSSSPVPSTNLSLRPRAHQSLRVASMRIFKHSFMKTKVCRTSARFTMCPCSSTGYLAEVTVFPCTDLTIGTWRRMASPQHDLIAYVCEGKRCLTWFIRSGGRSFKMEILYEHILESRFANVSPGVGSATFVLERPPTFYMEGYIDPTLGEDSPRFWQVCGDWTEGMQGTTQLRHYLLGPAYQLSSLVNSITPSGMSNEISLYTPTPSVSDAGSSPEVYTRSLHSPVEQIHGSTLVLRRPSSLSSLRMLHHPSLERLRSRQASVPLFHSPLSSTSTPNSPYAPSEGSGSTSMSPTTFFLDGSDPRQYMRQSATGTPDQLTQLPLPMPNLPRVYEYPMARPDSPYDCASEPPNSAVSTPAYFDVSPSHPTNGPWGGPSGGMDTNAGGPGYVLQNAPAEERHHDPYYQYPTGLPGPVHSYTYENSGH